MNQATVTEAVVVQRFKYFASWDKTLEEMIFNTEKETIKSMQER